jgi:hypothetical protein
MPTEQSGLDTRSWLELELEDDFDEELEDMFYGRKE